MPKRRVNGAGFFDIIKKAATFAKDSGLLQKGLQLAKDNGLGSKVLGAIADKTGSSLLGSAAGAVKSAGYGRKKKGMGLKLAGSGLCIVSSSCCLRTNRKAMSGGSNNHVVSGFTCTR